MKKRFIVLLLVLSMLLAVSVPAMASTQSKEFAPALTFSGTTANCSIIVAGDSTEDQFYVTLKLWCGSACLATWHGSGTGWMTMNETQTVEPGYTYDLTADVVINGTLQPRVSVQATCP